MRKSWITLAALLAGVVALGLFAWLKPPKPQTAAVAVSALKSADAHTLRLLHKGKPLATLEKRGATWFMTAPMQAPADDFQLLRVLAILDAKSALQYPLAHLAKFELDAPLTEIIINDQRYAFGAINTVTREQYVLTPRHVFPVALNYGAAVPADARALLRRSVLAPGEAPARFEFGVFTVDTDGKKWSAAPPAGELSQDDYNRWVAQWREGNGLRAEAIDKRKPASELHITLKDGARISLGVVQTEPELIVRRVDAGLQFVFTAEVGKKMLSPPVANK